MAYTGTLRKFQTAFLAFRSNFGYVHVFAIQSVLLVFLGLLSLLGDIFDFEMIEDKGKGDGWHFFDFEMIEDKEKGGVCREGMDGDQ